MKITPLTDKSALVILLTLTFVCFLPFLDKPFHIDEPLFLWTAEQIRRCPFDFYGFVVNWDDFAKPMASVTQNPPLAAYYLALLAWLFGWNELPLHLGFLFTGFAAVWGTYKLARDISLDIPLALVAALTVFCTPVFFVSANSVMCDMMMVAAWVWAIVWWRRALLQNDWKLFAMSGIAITVASLAKYFGVALIPLLLVYSLVERRRPGVWLCLFLLPLIALGTYQLLTIRMYGHGLLSNAAAYAAAINSRVGVIPKSMTTLVFAGGCLSSIFFSIPFMTTKRGLEFSLSAALTLFALLTGTRGQFYFTAMPHVSAAYFVQVAIMATSGFLIIFIAAQNARQYRNADSLLLFCWVMGTLIFTGYLNWTISARNILPMAPAVGLTVALRMRNRHPSRTSDFFRQWTVRSMLPALLLSFMVSRADYMHAVTARKAAHEIRRDLPVTPDRIWFKGHWGFQYYMQLLGMKPLDKFSAKVGKGDFIVVPDNNSNTEPLAVTAALPVKQYLHTASCCISTMNLYSGSGFYSHFWGNVPFLFGPAPGEGYRLFQVQE